MIDYEESEGESESESEEEEEMVGHLSSSFFINNG